MQHPEIIKVSYDQSKMALTVHLTSGIIIYTMVHLGEYREFQQSGFSYSHYEKHIVGHFHAESA